MVTGSPCRLPKRRVTLSLGGTINQTGSLIIRAEKVGDETMLSRIVQMVADAQRSRAPSREWLTAFQAGLFLW